MFLHLTFRNFSLVALPTVFSHIFCLLKRMSMRPFDYKIYGECSNIEPIVEFYRISGEDDYLLKVVVANM
jgi:hypothetical protein